MPLSDKEVDEIKHSLKINNLEVSNLNANTVSGWYSDQTNVVEFEPSLSNKDEILRKWRIDYTKKAIQLASELECDSICITTGLKHYENIEYETTVLMESLSNILEFAEKFGIKIAMEYEPGLLVENSEEVLDISNDFKDLGLNLSLIHI